ncbi:MAG: hypothetical protein AAF805_12305, partial [Planctomycetota bacterium]
TLIAYTIEDPLYSAGSVDHPHTHAFDVYACPFPARSSGFVEKTWAGLTEDSALFEVAGLATVAGLTILGSGLRRWDPDGRIEAALSESKGEEPPAGGRESLLDLAVPGPVLGVVAIAGLVVLSVVGCFVYYPDPAETLEDLKMVRADALTYATAQDVENCVRSIERYDDLTRRLQVGHYLRNLELSEFQQAKARVLRGRLEQLKDVVEAGDFDRVRDLNAFVSAAHRGVREAFSDR